MSHFSRFFFRFIYAVIGQDNLMRIARSLNTRRPNRSPFTMTILRHDMGADSAYTLFGFRFVDRSPREATDPLTEPDTFTQRDFDECWDELINNPDSYEPADDETFILPDPDNDTYIDPDWHSDYDRDIDGWFDLYGQMQPVPAGTQLLPFNEREASYCTCPNWHLQEPGTDCPVCNQVVLPF